MYLLLPTSCYDDSWSNRTGFPLRSLNPPHMAGDYISLSPVTFFDAQELKDNLERYLPQPGKSRGRDVDTSKVNYMRTNGQWCAAFEHSR
jgi:hypothetical protein